MLKNSSNKKRTVRKTENQNQPKTELLPPNRPSKRHTAVKVCKDIKTVIKKAFKILSRVNSSNKINKHSIRGKKFQNKSKYKHNNKRFSRISAVSILSLTMSHSPPLPL